MNEAVSDLFRNSTKNHCEKGQVLVWPDEPPRGVFLLLSGYVKAYDISPDGSFQLIDISRPGTMFPVKWALGDEENYPLFYEAMCKSEFMVVSRQMFQNELALNQNFSRFQLDTMLALCRAYEQRIQNSHQRSINAKLAFHLLFLHKHFGHLSDSLGWIDVPLTYQDIADSLSTSRESISRSLTQLINQGLVVRVKNRLAIKDAARLRAYISEEDLTLDVADVTNSSPTLFQ